MSISISSQFFEQIFEDVTRLFSQAEVPLVHQVIPMLEKLEHQLQFTLDHAEAPNVIRIAAQAGLMMVGKYYALTDDNEVYRIAMGEPFSLKQVALLLTHML